MYLQTHKYEIHMNRVKCGEGNELYHHTERAGLRLTAANFIRVVRTVHVVVTLLVFPDALTISTGELIQRTTHCRQRQKTHHNNFQ